VFLLFSYSHWTLGAVYLSTTVYIISYSHWTLVWTLSEQLSSTLCASSKFWLEQLSPAQLDESEEMEDSDDELAMSASLPDEPLTFAEALTRPDAEKWRQAALEELAAHQSNGTWTLVPRPAVSKVIGSKWVFQVKRNADGSVDRYKARLVAKGYNQRPGFDYLEVFAPTVRLSSIRVILALAALQDLHLVSFGDFHLFL